MSISVSVPYGSGFRAVSDAYKSKNIFKIRLSHTNTAPSVPVDYVPLEEEESDSDSDSDITYDTFLS